MSEKIKKAMDNFENDLYMDAKDDIRDFIRNRVNNYLQNKIGVSEKSFDTEEED